jgi:anti-sigma factor (TIGR02949 family)
VNCEVVREKLSCYVDRVVDEATLEMIESHLAGCTECSAELHALEAMQASLLTVAEVDPPTRLSYSIREAISREEQSVPAECDHVMAMLSEYVDGELATDDVLTVRSHVEACESCAHELSLTQSLIHAAGSVTVEPPTELRSRIMAATVESATPFQKLTERVVTALRPARAVLVGATAVAAAAAFLMVGRPSNQPSGVGSEKIANNPTQTVNPVAKVEVVDKPVVAAALGIPHVASTHRAHRWHVANPAVVATATPALAPTANATSSVKPAGKTTDSKEIVASNTETLRIAEAEVAEKPADPALITISDAEAKKVIHAAEAAEKKEPVKVASGHPVILPDDDRAMIKSLKQQLRMQKKGETISVDLLGSKF